jgi:hypothetical protein
MSLLTNCALILVLVVFLITLIGAEHPPAPGNGAMTNLAQPAGIEISIDFFHRFP